MAAAKLFSAFVSRNSYKFAKLGDANTQQIRKLASRTPLGPKVKYLERANGNKIAYRQVVSKNTNNLPGVVFCSGFQSNMNGVKAMAIEEYCRQKDLSYVRFDYQGCGQSDGDIREMTLTDWKGDMMSILDQITAGPQVMVGSSMGGWLMLFAAMERPHRIHSLVGIATAADFPTRGFTSYPQQVQDEIEREGVAVYKREDFTYVLTKKFLEDAKKHEILSLDNIPITCPVRLLHGMTDETVSWDCSLQIAKKLWSSDVHCLFRKAGDHRFSQPDDIELLFEILNYLVFGAEEMQTLALKSWKSYSVYEMPDHLVAKDKVHDQIEHEGLALVTEGDYTYVLTKRFMDDAKNHTLTESEDLHITCPVHLLHGLHDEVIPYQNSVELAQKLFTQDVQVVFSKAGDHHFTQANDIQLVFETLDLLVFGAGDVRELAITSWSSVSRYPNPDFQADDPTNNYQTFHYRKG